MPPKLEKLEELLGKVEDQLWSIQNGLPDNQKKEFRQIYALTHKIFTDAASHVDRNWTDVVQGVRVDQSRLRNSQCN